MRLYQVPHWICCCALWPLDDSQLMHLFYKWGDFEVGFTFPLTMEGCGFRCQVLCCSLQATCVTHGQKYAILGGDSLTYFRSCEAGQGEGRCQSAGLRAAFKSRVTVPSKCFRADLAAQVEMGGATWDALKPLRHPHGQVDGTEALWETHTLLEQQPGYFGVSSVFLRDTQLSFCSLLITWPWWNKPIKILEESEEYCVPQKFFIYGGNDVHRSNRLQLLSFEGNQL